MPRITPLSPPYQPEVLSALLKWMPPGSSSDSVLELFRTLLVRQDLADRARPLGAGLLGHGQLSPADRELVIDRVCARCGAEYEWGVHVTAFGSAVGLSPEQLQATAAQQPEPALFTPHQQALMLAVDELHDTSTMTDATWAPSPKASAMGSCWSCCYSWAGTTSSPSWRTGPRSRSSLGQSAFPSCRSKPLRCLTTRELRRPPVRQDDATVTCSGR